MAFVICNESVAFDDKGAAKERFLAEAPRAWQQYRAHTQNLQGTILQKLEHLAPGKMERSDRYEFKQRKGCALFREGANDDAREHVKIVNARYGFELERKSADAPWAVLALGASAEERFQKTVKSVDGWAACGVYPTVLGHPQGDLADPRCRIGGVDTVTKDGLLLFKVAFEIKPPADGGRTPAVAGWILCDPAAHWIIRESEVELRRVEFNTRDVVRNVYEYREGTDGFPTVNRVVQDYQRPSTGHHNRFTWEFELKDSEAPEETFMLSGYGLPELRTGSSPTPTRWYLWVLAAALGCFALAVVLRRRASLRGNT